MKKIHALLLAMTIVAVPVLLSSFTTGVQFNAPHNAADTIVADTASFNLKASMERGKELYATYCQSCHMEAGDGIEGVYPPLAKSDYMMADTKRSIREILYGVTGEMTVNGVSYNIDMPGTDLTDEQASDLLNFIRNSWENKGAIVLPRDIKDARKKE